MNTNQVARVAGLVGEPARAAMLLELMDGRALTAQELARAGRVTPQTASRHLARLVDSGLLRVEPRGRHRYHRLASADVARLLEGIIQLAAREDGSARRPVVTGPRDSTLRLARTCYDHIAGRLGVALADRLVSEGAIDLDSEAARVLPRAGRVLSRWGVSVAPEPAAGDNRSAAPRPVAAQALRCRPCLDWSERRLHLAGPLARRLCAHCLESGWLVRRGNSRALQVTPKGAGAFQAILGMAVWRRVVDGGPVA